MILGGSVSYILQAELECTGPYDLGKGYVGYVAKSPSGKSFVSEEKSMAIIGNHLYEVQQDVKMAKKQAMISQILDAKKKYKEMDVVTVSPQDFFNKIT